MYCEILSTLYVKSNGDIPCDDDYGEQVILANLNDSPTIGQIVKSPTLNNIETRLLLKLVPHDGICQNCAFFHPEQSFENRIRKFHLNKIQVETSLSCSLSCWGCSRIKQVRQRRGQLFLDKKQFQTLIVSCAEDNYNIDWVEYCGQGEPLNHPEFSQFVKIVSEFFPNTQQTLTTNGNNNFNLSVGEETLHQIIVSCDGASQEKYEIYRRGGDWEKCIRFMKDAVANKNANNHPHVIWKYILFDHNDSDEEIAKANEIAQNIGVDRLLFILTHSQGKSKRYTNENFSEILKIAPSAVINLTCALINSAPRKYSHVYVGKATEQLGLPENKQKFRLYLDEIKMIDKQHLLLKGWAANLDFSQIKKLKVFANSKFLGYIEVSHLRRDVMKHFHIKENTQFGFAVVLPTNELSVQDIFSLEITPESWSFTNYETHKYLVNFTPLTSSNGYVGKATEQLGLPENKQKFRLYLDEIKMIDKQHLLLKGWAANLDFSQIKKLKVFANSKFLGYIEVSHLRRDVMKHFHIKENTQFGFAVVLPTNELSVQDIFSLEITPESWSFTNYETHKYLVNFTPLMLS
ncbi:MAG: 4Fe-4S cluster-binding domain-containing protein [Limnospira sp. PMC 1291.21]|uniref:radical SAM protein n=1 Tax=Limnospira sp. PMC 1291.21 TaxID=2981074 RepID=UPI0028E16B5C|nr:4Fe-4S cluster-binding domain-containing protein [Limnospira sp. PMC 1291.21]MDT9304248.1 4Fe-4S cluster-binding domain-containing protein [Limnospira sp. PMC 1291.21]